MDTLKIIEQEAVKVREWALKNGAPNDFECWCAICSFELFKILHDDYHINTEFVMTHEGYEWHCFLIWEDYLIDVTATQFDKNLGIIIWKKEKCKGIWFWDLRPRHASIYSYSQIGDIKSVLSIWPEEQDPFRLFGKCG